MESALLTLFIVCTGCVIVEEEHPREKVVVEEPAVVEVDPYHHRHHDHIEEKIEIK